ncbi:hypothetical protein GCM10007854_12670 [Algimonas porphyrae]|uniref:Uncharacterized protein n=2 Tax=Algimonas porphyrae TaxID=1128113 RepID=A0ABQ5V023_9PROT|nr:hypothetical protein GCM10007854_12670 [Algimonas porphyrae]
MPIILTSLVISACASTADDTTFRGEDTMSVEQAVVTPVNDLGLDDIDIPEALLSLENPYAETPETCSALSEEVVALNALLGEDLDVPEDEAERRERLALNASSSAIGSILIPFRGVVRAVSGAASNERDARMAYQRGLVRRAYLKGMAGPMGCDL